MAMGRFENRIGDAFPGEKALSWDGLFSTLREKLREWAECPLVFSPPLMLVILLGMFEPEIVIQMHPTLHSAFKAAVYGGYLVAAFSVLRWEKVPRTGLFVIALFASAVLSDSLARGFSWGVLESTVIDCAQMFLLCGLTVLWMRSCAKRFLGITSLLFVVLGVVNLGIEVLFPEGLYQAPWTHEPCFLFGHKNSVMTGMIPGLLTVGVWESISRRGKSSLTLAYLLLMLANVAASHSSTSMAAVAVLLVVYALYRTFPELPLTPTVVGVSGFLASVGLVFFQMQKYFDGVLGFLFGKTGDFSSRVLIWEKYVEFFLGSPLTGIGRMGSEALRFETGGVNAHNCLLSILSTGGVFRLVVYAVGLVSLGMAASPFLRDNGVRAFVLVLIAFAIYGLMETFDPSWYLIFSCAVLEGHLRNLWENHERVN